MAVSHQNAYIVRLKPSILQQIADFKAEEQDKPSADGAGNRKDEKSGMAFGLHRSYFFALKVASGMYK